MAIPIFVPTYTTRRHSYSYIAFPYTVYTAFQAKTPHTVHRIFCRTSTLQNTVCTIYDVIWAVYSIPYIVYVPGRAPAVSTGVRYDIRFNTLLYNIR
jgi:hypothetical protein